MKLHDEIAYKGRKLIIDTSELPGYPEKYETLAYRSNFVELDQAQTADAEQAKKNHAEMLDRFRLAETQRLEQAAATAEQAQKPLSGKYAKLRDDLRAAFEQTAHLELTEDGGTCNHDAPALALPRWREELVERAAKEAGGGAWKWTLWGSSRYVIGFPTTGQANRRSRRAEALEKILRGMGYDCFGYAAMD